VRALPSLTVAAMTPWTRLAGAACAGVLASALLAGCGGSSPAATGATPHTSASAASPSASAKTAKAPRPPDVGSCRNLSYTDISRFSNEDPTTSCRAPHTSYTFDVRQLPDDVAFQGVQIGNDAVQNAAAAACERSFGRFVGGSAATQALARLTVTYFVPPQSDFDLGAHWVRCDVVALQSSNELAPLPRVVRNVLGRADALARFGVCSRGEPGSPAVRLVMCDQEHAFRAVAAFRLGSSASHYPDEAVARDGGEQRCRDLLDQMLGPEGGYTYAWTYPSPTDWRKGQRFGYCWHKTNS
jgi:Septum formation